MFLFIVAPIIIIYLVHLLNTCIIFAVYTLRCSENRICKFVFHTFLGIQLSLYPRTAALLRWNERLKYKLLISFALKIRLIIIIHHVWNVPSISPHSLFYHAQLSFNLLNNIPINALILSNFV